MVTRKSAAPERDRARALNEDIALIKTVNRLSRQAGREDLAWRLTRFVARQGAQRVKRDTLLVIDPSDLAKKHSEKMQYLARVRDGSTGQLADGYWLCQVVAVECGGQEITPLVNHLWSAEAPRFCERERGGAALRGRGVALQRGSRHLGHGPRGGDRIHLFDTLLQCEPALSCAPGGQPATSCGAGASGWRRSLPHARTPLPFIEHVTKQNSDGSEKVIELSFGTRAGAPARVARPAAVDACGQRGSGKSR